MLITTTPNIEGKRIKEYLGIVTGETVGTARTSALYASETLLEKLAEALAKFRLIRMR